MWYVQFISIVDDDNRDNEIVLPTHDHTFQYNTNRPTYNP